MQAHGEDVPARVEFIIEADSGSVLRVRTRPVRRASRAGNKNARYCSWVHAGGRVAVAALQEDGNVAGLRFAGNGPGISAEEREAVSLPFNDCLTVVAL